ncbi:MAG: acyltransferase [Alphaproteobacteria bacterium]|nr:acyltransferase [Alphaproteobacteria bacterium]
MPSQQSHLSRPHYRPDIDGLRAIAVLAVVAFHAFPNWVRGGFTGVDVFFVISGYLISTIIFENLDKGTFSFSEFYARRIKRIFPDLILVLVACFAFGWFALLADEYKQLGKHIAAGAGFIANIVLWRESGYFDNAAATKPLLHLWSLGIEEQFYIVWPLSLWLAYKRKFNLLAVIGAVAVGSFILNLMEVKHHAVAAFYSPQTRFWELSSGSLLAWATLYKKNVFNFMKGKIGSAFGVFIKKEKQKKNLSNILSFVGLWLVACGFWKINRELSFPGVWALAPVLGAMCIIAAGPQAWGNRIVLSNKVAVWFGLISFPLYLWHWPLLSFARIIEGQVPGHNTRISLVFLSVGLAWLTYKIIECPVRFGKRSKSKIVVLVILMVIIGGAGYGSYMKNGLGFRFGNYERISNAVGDWGYPKGLRAITFQGIPIYLNASDKPEIVLFGDSHLEQYGPEVAYLTKKGKAKSVAFITGGGCPPIPNVYENQHPSCLGLTDKFLAYLKKTPSVKDIVIAACFNCYFIDNAGPPDPAEDVYRYYYKKGSLIEPFRGGGGKNASIGAFVDFVAGLQKNYKVYVLMDNPHGRMFDPKFMLDFHDGRRPIFLPYSYRFNPGRFSRDPREISLENELAARLLPTGAVVIDQAHLVCPNNLCISVDDLGRPIYKDSSHMRPFFIRERMDALDKIVSRLDCDPVK